MKLYQDPKIKWGEFIAGNNVLLFDPRLKLFLGKLKKKWKDPYRVVIVFPYGAIVLEIKEGLKWKVKGKKVKYYFGEDKESRLVCVVDLKEAWVIMSARVMLQH